MKKTFFRLILAAGFMVLLSSCFSIPTTFKLVFDEEHPAGDTAIVTFVNNDRNGWFHVEEYNGIPVAEYIYKKKDWGSNDKTVLTIPAGVSSFIFEARYTFVGSQRITTYRIQGVGLEYNLEAGKKYEVKGRSQSQGFLKGYDFFVGIYDTTGKSSLLQEWKLEVEF